MRDSLCGARQPCAGTRGSHTLLGASGKDDPRAFPLFPMPSSGVSTSTSSCGNAAGEALVKLGDPRGVEVIEQVVKKIE